MSALFQVQSTVTLVIFLVLLAVKVFAFVDALRRRPQLFPAADKQTKQLWLIVLGLSLAAHLLLPSPIGVLNLAGTVGSLVYLADVRPALQSLTDRR